MYKLVREIKLKTSDSFKIKINQKSRRSYKIYDNLTLTVMSLIWMTRKIRIRIPLFIYGWRFYSIKNLLRFY